VTLALWSPGLFPMEASRRLPPGASHALAMPIRSELNRDRGLRRSDRAAEKMTTRIERASQSVVARTPSAPPWDRERAVRVPRSHVQTAPSS
jgi:hypothetical protein